MKENGNFEYHLLKFFPYLVGATIISGSLVVFTNIAFGYTNSKAFIIEIGMALIIAIGIYSFTWQDYKAILRTKIALGMLIFWIVAMIALFHGIDPVLSWLGNPERATGMLLLTLLIFGSLVVGILIKKTNTHKLAILYPIVISGAILGLTSYFKGNVFGLSWAPNGGLLGNSSFLATYCFSAFFIAIYLFTTTKLNKERVIVAILGLFAVVNPAFINFDLQNIGSIFGILGDARGAGISLIIGIIVSTTVYFSVSKGKIPRTISRIFLLIVIAILILGATLLFREDNSIKRFFSEKAGETRFLYWESALLAFSDHPYLGSGPETFRYSYEKYIPADLLRVVEGKENSIWTDKPHNTYLGWLVETGIIGLTAYIFMLICVLWSAVRIYKRRSDRWLLSITIGFVSAYVLNNFIFFDTPTSYLVFFMISAWLLSQEVDETDSALSPQFSNENIKLVKSLVAIIFIILFSLTIGRMYSKMFLALKEGRVPIKERMLLYKQTELVSSYGSGIFLADRIERYVVGYQKSINEIAKVDQASREYILRDIDNMISTIEEGFSKFPVNTKGLLTIGNLASLKIVVMQKLDQGSLETMKDSAEEVILLSPNLQLGYWLLASAYIYEDNYGQALTQLQTALSLDIKNEKSYQYIINLAQLTKNKELLDETTKEMDMLPSK